MSISFTVFETNEEYELEMNYHNKFKKHFRKTLSCITSNEPLLVNAISFKVCCYE